MHGTQPTPVVTLDHAIAAVRHVISRSRGRADIELTTGVRFDEDLGLTSLDIGEVFVRLEELVGAPLDTSDMQQTRSIGDLTLVRLADKSPALST